MGLATYNGFTDAQRNRAQRWLNKGWADGTIPRPTACRACGQRLGILHAHAEDYSEPYGPHLLEFPLCYRCHMMVHCRFGRGQRAFSLYVTAIEEGWMFPPLYRPNFDVIRGYLDRPFVPSGLEPDGMQHHSPPLGEPTVLRRIALGLYDPRGRKTTGQVRLGI